MDFDNLKTFIAVADSGSFSLAAERLHLTQPAVSKRIGLLEADLQVKLFDRLGRRVLLTAAGQLLLPRARRLLAELQETRRALQNLASEVVGHLTIATSHHIGLHRLPPILRRYAARYSRVQLDMRFVDSEQGCDAVLKGEAELAIVTLPPSLLVAQQSALEAAAIWNDPLSLMLPVNHRLLGDSSPITPAQLRHHSAILPAEATFTRRIIDDFFRARSIELKVAFATNYLETIKMMVAVGLGWSILPQSMADGEVVAAPVEGMQLSRTLGVVRHREHALSNPAQAMLTLLQQAANGSLLEEDGLH